MMKFLSAVARGYSKQYKDLSGLTFVMPNKRSGAYLLKAFSNVCERTMIAPRIITISDFIENTADNVIVSRIELLFRLFECYKSLPNGEQDVTFEKFSSWGETVINDFNEIDMQMVDPEEIFKNVYDLNSIRSNFLTPEQKKVMVEYFNYSPELASSEYERFWKDFDKAEEREKENAEGGNSKGLRKKFRTVWQLLLPLYTTLKNNLAEAGLTTNGGAYREAVEKIEGGYEPYVGERIIFVGFNALSEAEARIFRELKERGRADFVWDLAPSVFARKDEPALKYVAINSSKSNFPMPEWLRKQIEDSYSNELPEIKVISVPSNVMQAKVAAKELMEFKEKNVAVILPDENMLLPMLYSIPPNLGVPNLTMGFQMRHTPVISFVTLLKKLHQRVVREDGNTLLWFEDVKDFLSHPYSALLFNREKVEKFIRYYQGERKIVVPLKTLERLGENVPLVFRFFPENVEPGEIIEYILSVLNRVREKLRESEAKDKGILHSEVELVYIGTFTDSLIRMANCIAEFNVKISPGEVFHIAERVIGGENVALEGNKLNGLQVMGVLETRCLDFDKIVMLSVNEKVMPRVGRSSTFIPNVVRTAFGMPPANYQEELFAYYFFRILARSHDAILTYDSRASETRTPGPSRYLLQLKYLAEKPIIEEVEARFDLPRGMEGNIKVEKTEALRPYIDRYIISDEENQPKDKIRNFSASSLNNYFICPLRFLYNDVLRLGTEREKIETIDAIGLGLIVHSVVESLYFPPDKRGRMLERPILITPDYLKGLLDEPSAMDTEDPDDAAETGMPETRIEREVRKAILKVHFEMPDEKLEKGKLKGSAAIIFEYIVGYVRNVLKADLADAPFRLWGSEISRTLDLSIPVDNGETHPVEKKISVKMVIDRLDQEGAEGADRPFRIVDYKTGKVGLWAADLNEVFEGSYSAHNIFQLFFYAELFLLLIKRGEIKIPGNVPFEEFEKRLKVLIYRVAALPDMKGKMVPAIGETDGTNRNVPDIGTLREIENEEELSLMDNLKKKIGKIIDEATPFEAEPSETRCKICDFRLQCEMKRAEKENLINFAE